MSAGVGRPEEMPVTDELKPTLVALDQFNGTSAFLETAVKRWIDWPIDRSRRRIAVASKANIKSWGGLVTTILESPLEPPRIADSIASFMLNADAVRSEFLASLLPEGGFCQDGRTIPDEAAKFMERFAEGSNANRQIHTRAVSLFEVCLEQDLEKLDKAVAKSHKAYQLSRLQVAGRHSLEVGKLSAGIALGALMAKKFGKYVD